MHQKTAKSVTFFFKKQTFTVLVYLKTSKINSKGKAPICIRVTVNGMRSEISIKQFIEPTRWNSNRQRLNGISYRVKTINKTIELAINRINELSGRHIPLSKIGMVGDTLHTDILGANSFGLKSILMTKYGLLKNTNVGKMIKHTNIIPDYIVESP